MLGAVALLLVAASLPAQPAWEVGARPVFDWSGQLGEGALLLERPVGGVLTRQGTVLVADAGAGHVLGFDAAGRVSARAGREGAGPDEFRAIEAIGRCAGDSAVVWDRGADRLTYVSPDGRLLGQVRTGLPPEVVTRALSMTCAPSGLVALVTLPRRPKVVEGEIVRGPSTVALVQLGQGRRTFPVEVPSSEMVVRGGGGAPRPLGRTTTVLTDGRRVYVGTADSGYVAVYTPDGRPLPGIRVASAARPVTTADYDAAVEALALQAPSAVQDRMTALLASQPRPRQMPPYHGLHLDAEGALWVRTSAHTEADTRFLVYASDGRPAGQVTVPRSITVFDIGRDRILGTYADADGEPHVVVYRFQRR